MKETIRKVKRQPSEWEKIIANEATDKESISKIYIWKDAKHHSLSDKCKSKPL